MLPITYARAQTVLYFATLKNDTTNVRTGPGTIHPIKYIYHKKNLPLKVIASHDVWRQVQDFQGNISWVHSQLLARRKYAMVTRPMSPAFATIDDISKPDAHIRFGEVAAIEECRVHACLCKFSITQDGNPYSVNLWLKKDDLFGDIY